MREAFKENRAEIILFVIGLLFFLIAGIKTMLMGCDFAAYSVEKLHGVFNLAIAGALFMLIAFGVHLLKKRENT